MGDLSAEPSMEEILSSIKRIIAEEGDGGQPRARRAPRPQAVPLVEESDGGGQRGNAGADEPILELSDPMPEPDSEPEASRLRSRAETPLPSDAILSQEAAAASRGALDALSKMMVKSEAGSDGTLEGLVREMLRPMLAEWLDANLPDMVESMVAREIARITGQR
jgi:cell pole-organizing protein PopZ